MVKLTTYSRIIFTNFQQTKLCSFQNLSGGVILKIFFNIWQISASMYRLSKCDHAVQREYTQKMYFCILI